MLARLLKSFDSTQSKQINSCKSKLRIDRTVKIQKLNVALLPNLPNAILLVLKNYYITYIQTNILENRYPEKTY